MTKIIYGIESIEVSPSLNRPERGMLKTLTFMDARRDNPGISYENARRLSGLAADLILRDYDALTDSSNN